MDLAWQHRQIAGDIEQPMLEVMSRGGFIQGPEVRAFEEEFARYSGVAHCVGVANGTDALELAFRASGLQAGQGVILPANTFIATAESVVRAGGRPVLVDCDSDGLIDVDAVAGQIDTDAAFVTPVHLYGQMADMEALSAVTKDRGIRIVEDAAQAQGAARHGRGIGSWGMAAGTSFYPGKNLGAYGDAGAVLTNDPEIAATIRRLGNHGSESKYAHSDIGSNSRLDTIQAVVLSAKLRRLNEWNEMRRFAADCYTTMLQPLADDGVVCLPQVAPGNLPVWHLYMVRLQNRDAVLDSLLRAGIGAGIHYPVPVHLTEALRYLGYHPGDFPVAEARGREILSLPIYPGITEEIIERVVAVLTGAIVTLE